MRSILLINSCLSLSRSLSQKKFTIFSFWDFMRLSVCFFSLQSMEASISLCFFYITEWFLISFSYLLIISINDSSFVLLRREVRLVQLNQQQALLHTLYHLLHQERKYFLHDLENLEQVFAFIKLFFEFIQIFFGNFKIVVVADHLRLRGSGGCTLLMKSLRDSWMRSVSIERSVAALSSIRLGDQIKLNDN